MWCLPSSLRRTRIVNQSSKNGKRDFCKLLIATRGGAKHVIDLSELFPTSYLLPLDQNFALLLTKWQARMNQ